MVVAEVPLWVVHNDNSSEQLQQSLQVLEGGGGVSSPSAAGGGGFAAAGAAAAPPSPSTSVRANAAVALLKQGKSMKSPIYSVDAHPSAPIFATGGGDGTVKIWNSHALFPQQHQHHHSKKQKKHDGKNDVVEGHYDPDTGAYVSNSSSSSSSSSGGEGSEDDDDKEESSSSSSASSSSDNELLQQPSTAARPDIHDLSDRVRHKTNGGTVRSPSSRSAAAAAAALSSSPSRASATNGNKTPVSSPATTAAAPTTDSNKRHRHHHARLLATLTAHTGSCVLCVRFSNQGKLLASAGDDAVVCIYQRLPDSHQWVRIRLCRGHGLDVVDLAWAPDDSHIVSASLDSATPIIVWKLNTGTGTNNNNNTNPPNSMILSPYKVLGRQIHTSCVKGVTFDPAGSYLASSGDDPAICVWRAHDDWGLEQRIESIFDPSQKQESMFRRLSWSTDGSFICSTNSVVQKKHVASTVSREGWNASSSSPQHQAPGGANLVGHRQPVVVSRHAPILLNNSNNKQDADDDGNNRGDNGNSSSDPKYATLLALGDKRGFVTVWTTKKSRPLFKLQCSESRCCVTDLAWGKLSSHHCSNNNNGGGASNPDLMLLVTLLDGQVVALHFTSDEIGPVLTPKEQARVFALRYGIDADGDGPMSGLFVGETGGPKFIESTLQMSLEEQQEDDDNIPGMEVDDEDEGDTSDEAPAQQEPIPPPQQTTTTAVDSKGRKRVRPVLVSVGAPSSPKKTKRGNSTRRGSGASKQQQVDPLQRAIQAAEKASSTTQQRDRGGGTVTTTSAVGESEISPRDGQSSSPLVRQTYAGARATAATLSSVEASANMAVPYSTDRVHVAELPVNEDGQEQVSKQGYMAECTNSLRVPRGSNGGPVSIVDVCLTRDGRIMWRDQIPGTSCCSVAASRNFLAVGTADGIIQLYGCSPSKGWTSGCSFRSHPPLVLGHPVVTLRLEEKKDSATEKVVEMLVVTADGAFALYSLLPNLSLQYKGSIMPALTHMALSASSSSSVSSSADRNILLPKLSRIQLTESGRLLMLLSMESPAVATSTNQHSAAGGSCGGPASSTNLPESVGGAMQAFVYDRPSELWMRMSDSRFVLSDFYSSLPSSSNSKTTKGTTLLLGELDDTVRIGSLQSPLKANSIYNQNEDDSRNFDATRSHCEDRMACALAIGSSCEFKHWLGLYVRILSLAGQSSMLRVLADMLQTGSGHSYDGDSGLDAASTSWWLCSAPDILGLERLSLVKSIIIPELSKNRSLQRLTNELSLELSTTISKSI